MTQPDRADRQSCCRLRGVRRGLQQLANALQALLQREQEALRLSSPARRAELNTVALDNVPNTKTVLLNGPEPEEPQARVAAVGRADRAARKQVIGVRAEQLRHSSRFAASVACVSAFAVFPASAAAAAGNTQQCVQVSFAAFPFRTGADALHLRTNRAAQRIGLRLGSCGRMEGVHEIVRFVRGTPHRLCAPMTEVLGHDRFVRVAKLTVQCEVRQLIGELHDCVWRQVVLNDEPLAKATVLERQHFSL